MVFIVWGVFSPLAASLICLLCHSAALSLFVHSGLFLSMKLALPNLIHIIIFHNSTDVQGWMIELKNILLIN